MQHGNSRLLAALHALRNHSRALFRSLQTSNHACRNLRGALRPPGLRRRSRGESELACPVRLAAGPTLCCKCRGALRAALPSAPGARSLPPPSRRPAAPPRRMLRPRAARPQDSHWKHWKNPCRDQPDGISVATGGCSNEFVPVSCSGEGCVVGSRPAAPLLLTLGLPFSLQCWHGRPAAIQQCPTGLVFNPWVQSCV